MKKYLRKNRSESNVIITLSFFRSRTCNITIRNDSLTDKVYGGGVSIRFSARRTHLGVDTRRKKTTTYGAHPPPTDE